MKHESAQRMIARLNPKGSATEMRVQGLRGGISAHDVAMAMAGSAPIDEWIARLIYAGQIEYRHLVHEYLIARAIKNSDRWGKCTYDQKRAIADIVMNDVAPDRVCGDCKGRGIDPTSATQTDNCPVCQGVRFIKYRPSDKWEMLGTTERTYYRVWNRRVKEVSADFSVHESVVVNKIIKYLD